MADFRNSVTPIIIRQARNIRLAAFDVDGTMTDGTLAYADNGSEIKMFNALDGHGLKALAGLGITTAILSARRSATVQRRAEELSIPHVVQGATDKLAALRALAQTLGLSLAQCAFMGDDLADLEALRHCGLACSVSRAPLAVRENAHYVARSTGGGAVREFCELLSRAQHRKVS